MFEINVSAKGTCIVSEVIVDSYFFDKTQYEYAFYLFKNNKKVDTHWYTDKMKVLFNKENFSGDFLVKAYIRDKRDGTKRIYSSNILSLDI